MIDYGDVKKRYGRIWRIVFLRKLWMFLGKHELLLEKQRFYGDTRRSRPWWRRSASVYPSYGKDLRSAEKGCRCRKTGGRRLCGRGRKAENEGCSEDIVVIDEELKMDAHVGRITRSCFYQLRQIRTIRQSISDNAIRTLIHSFVVTRIDYCNSVLSASPQYRPNEFREFWMQQLVSYFEFRSCSSINADQNNLHWLPEVQRIKFKILQLVANCLHQRAPLYLQELCVLVSAVPGRRHLRSADQFCLVVNRCRLSSMQRRGFAVSGRWRGMICLWLYVSP